MRSPVPSPIRCLTSAGMVTWPLLVMVAVVMAKIRYI
jgi:hypothetical protein